jgi:hypothetical protein
MTDDLHLDEFQAYLLEKANKPKTISRRLAALAAYTHWMDQAG